jgi:excisionase family DNA binding protein
MENKILEKLSKIESLYLQQPEQILSFNETCSFLGYSKSYLYKLTHSRQIPHYKPNGKMLYFKKSDLEDWLLRNRVKTADEIEQEAIDYATIQKRK